MNTKYIYAGNPDKKWPWKCIPNTAEAQAEAIQDGHTAFTIYSFDFEPQKGKVEPLRYGSWWFDIDCKDNPSKAIETACALIEELYLRYCVNPESLNYFLSGSKGVHIEVPAILFGGCDGHANIHEIHKIMSQRLLKPRGMADLDRTLIDGSLYCGGKGKLLRAPNIQRPDGRYKVQISYSELREMDRQELLSLTLSPREDFVPIEIERTEGPLSHLYEFAKTILTFRKDNVTLIKELESVQECEFIEHCYKNQAILSEQEWFFLMTIFARFGELARPLVHLYSLGHPSYTEEETNKKFNQALRQEYTITCETIKKNFDCKRNCAIRSPIDLLMKNKANREIAESRFVSKSDGVYCLCDETGKQIHICSPLAIHGKMRKADGSGWARLVELTSADGKHKTFSIPMRDCSGRGEAARSFLVDQGLEMSFHPKANTLLVEYLCNGGPNEIFLHATKTGWHNDTYVLPDISFGKDLTEKIHFDNLRDSYHKTSGSLKDWQENVGSLCSGNSLLVLITSFSLTAPLLGQLKMEGGGVHIYGASSTGKTTCAAVAGSLCGGGGQRGFVRQWRSTDNALENTATMHNDNLLVLDEVGQAKAETINHVAYMLANGQGRERMRSDATSQKTRTWLLNFLSTGELTINDKIEETGKHRAMAGQSVRIIDLPIDKGKGINLFTNTHGYAETAELSNRLKQSCMYYYGTPLRAFLEQYCSNLEDVNLRINNYLDLYVESNTPPKAVGQVKRVLRKFALIAIAGELAIEWGILPYKKGDVEAATKEWFDIWVAERGSVGELEVERVLEKIQEHFETEKGNYRNSFNNPLFLKGYKIKHDGKDCYFMSLQHFNALTKGIARSTMYKVLKEKGWIALDKQGNPPDTKQTCDGSKRGIGFFPSVWEGEDDLKKNCAKPCGNIDLS